MSDIGIGREQLSGCERLSFKTARCYRPWFGSPGAEQLCGRQFGKTSGSKVVQVPTRFDGGQRVLQQSTLRQVAFNELDVLAGKSRAGEIALSKPDDIVGQMAPIGAWKVKHSAGEFAVDKLRRVQPASHEPGSLEVAFQEDCSVEEALFEVNACKVGWQAPTVSPYRHSGQAGPACRHVLLSHGLQDLRECLEGKAHIIWGYAARRRRLGYEPTDRHLCSRLRSSGVVLTLLLPRGGGRSRHVRRESPKHMVAIERRCGPPDITKDQNATDASGNSFAINQLKALLEAACQFRGPALLECELAISYRFKGRSSISLGRSRPDVKQPNRPHAQQARRQRHCKIVNGRVSRERWELVPKADVDNHHHHHCQRRDQHEQGPVNPTSFVVPHRRPPNDIGRNSGCRHVQVKRWAS